MIFALKQNLKTKVICCVFREGQVNKTYYMLSHFVFCVRFWGERTDHKRTRGNNNLEGHVVDMAAAFPCSVLGCGWLRPYAKPNMIVVLCVVTCSSSWS